MGCTAWLGPPGSGTCHQRQWKFSKSVVCTPQWWESSKEYKNQYQINSKGADLKLFLDTQTALLQRSSKSERSTFTPCGVLGHSTCLLHQNQTMQSARGTWGCLSTSNNIPKTFPHPVCKPRPVRMVWSPGKDIFRTANKLNCFIKRKKCLAKAVALQYWSVLFIKNR